MAVVRFSMLLEIQTAQIYRPTELTLAECAEERENKILFTGPIRLAGACITIIRDQFVAHSPWAVIKRLLICACLHSDDA
jgi:hypothetical protein